MVYKKKTIEKATISLDTPEPFRLSEMGVSGMRQFGGIVKEELVEDLNFPKNLKTYKQMMLHPAVNASINLYKAMIAKTEFRVLPVKKATAKERKQAEIIEQILQDMETPLEDVIASALSSIEYGFAPMEKVFRRRNKEEGSLYTDNLVGIKKIALRHQESISNFEFDDAGNDLVGMKQNMASVNDPFGRYSRRVAQGTVFLPRKKFMLFTTGQNKLNPYGTSPLRNVYLPWKYLQAIEELEASGISKDLQGLPLLTLPASYLASDAPAETKASLEAFKKILTNLQQNSQAGVLLPSDADPETKSKLFNLELLSTVGKKSFDTTDVKEYYRTMIFIGLAADILLMGNTQTGSFALGAIKNSLTATMVEGYLKSIVRVFNEDLIRHIYEENGWDVTRRCSLDYEGFAEIDLDSYSKAVQRIGAVGYLPQTMDVINDVLAKFGLDRLPDGTEVTSVLPEKTSRSGDGMATAGDGTSNSVAATDTSSMNSNNAA